MTVYTYASLTFLSTNSALSDTGADYDHRTAFPADITGLTINAGVIVYLVRESASLTRTMGDGDFTASGPICTITGNAVGGVYPDDQTVTHELILSNLGTLSLYYCNSSYIRFGVSDTSHTVSRVASKRSYIGAGTWNTQSEKINVPPCYLLNGEIGMAGNSTETYYPLNAMLDTVTLALNFTAQFNWIVQSGITAEAQHIWRNVTIYNSGLANRPQWATSAYPFSLFLQVGTLTFAGNSVSTSGVATAFFIKCYEAYVRGLDSGGSALTSGYTMRTMTKGNGILPGFWNCRGLGTDGRPECPTASKFMLPKNNSTIWPYGASRDACKALLLPYSTGSQNGPTYTQIEDWTAGTFDVLVSNGTVCKTNTGITLNANYGSSSSPVDIQLPAVKNRIRFDGRQFA